MSLSSDKRFSQLIVAHMCQNSIDDRVELERDNELVFSTAVGSYRL